MGRFKLEAGAVGGIKETIAVCAAYAKQRKQFDRPIAEFGLIQAKIGEMAARCFALESAIYRLAGLLDGVFDGIHPDSDDAPAEYHRAAEEYAIECSIVKVIGSELYSWATDEAIQIHGGYGYTEEFPVARAWRDQRLLRIGEGANEIVRMIIVNSLLRRERAGRLDLASATEAARRAPCAESMNNRTLESLSRQLNKAGLLLLDLARKEWGDELAEQQEVVAAIADIFSAAYVSESAILRACKLADSGNSGAALARDAALLCTAEALQVLQAGASAALNHLSSVDSNSEVSARIMGELMVWDRHDLIAIRRRIAAAALARESYPW
jgi:alkylation response protein AidB-like acyl-CoA dehydrogenase